MNTPVPLTNDQLQINQQLIGLLSQQIQAEGPMLFAEYMHRCLYEPGLGYYVNGLPKLGAEGDFVTAPEISADFGHCIAAQCAEILASIGGGDLLEFGGGSGQLACDVMLELARLDALPERYYLLDVSADLKQLQYERITEKLPPELASRIEWVSTFIEGFRGVVIANELFDAFPVQRFTVSENRVNTLYVDMHDNRFSMVEIHDQPTQDHVTDLQRSIGRKLEDGYASEYCPVIAPWWQSLADSIDTAAVIICDYGCERGRYYSALRSHGSTRCFYRHQVHDDPLVYQGLQDITADVDFTAVAGAAVVHGFTLEGYTSMTNFMLSLGAINRHQTAVSSVNDRDRIVATGKLKQVLLPEEMGERFMVAGFSINIDPVLSGFSHGDQSRLL